MKMKIDPYTGKPFIWNESPRPHVTVDRASNRSQVFAVGETRFAAGCGLFFMMEYLDTGSRPPVEAALRSLAEAGIGGDRSSGRGQFALHIREGFPLDEPEEGDGFTTLSPYWPCKGEVAAGALDDAHYSLLLRRGWVGSPEGKNLRKWDVRLLAEGAALRKRPCGALVDAAPRSADGKSLLPHPVWRSGLAFPVRCRMVQEE